MAAWPVSLVADDTRSSIVYVHKAQWHGGGPRCLEALERRTYPRMLATEEVDVHLVFLIRNLGIDWQSANENADFAGSMG